MSFNSLVVCRRSALALALSSLVSTAFADATQPPVVVTATRTPLSIDETLSSVALIQRVAIEASGSFDLVDLLRREAGIDIIRGGGVGSQASVFLRGAGSNQVLVLIDGVRVASANTGGYAWEHLPLEQIERIEIVRGPRAALYGSDAIGGVIQIFTRRQAAFGGSLGLGNYGTQSVELAGGVQGERGQLGARLNYLDTEGFSAQNPRGYGYDPDRDGALQRSLSVYGDYQWDALAFEGSVLHSDDDVEFDQGASAVKQTSASFALAGLGGNPWRLAASADWEQTITPDFFARFDSRRRQFDWQQAMRLQAHGELLWGATAVFDRGRSVDTFSGSTQYGDQRDHTAAFAAWRAGHAAWNWELAGRHDDYDGFGGESTGQAALGWQPVDHMRLRANWGQGFRAPNLNELYSPGFGGLFAGNPDLHPERSRNVEIGADFKLGEATRIGVAAYRNEVRDLVDFSGGDTFQAINIGRSRLRGVELEAATHLAGWRLDGNIGWQDAVNRDTGSDLLRRAPRKANLQIGRASGDWSYGVDVHAAAARPEFGGALPGYALLGAHLRWQLNAEFALDLRLDNLFDRSYELARGFNAPGTTALLHLRWTAADPR